MTSVTRARGWRDGVFQLPRLIQILPFDPFSLLLILGSTLTICKLRCQRHSVMIQRQQCVACNLMVSPFFKLFVFRAPF